MVQTLLLETTLLNSLVSSESWVYTKARDNKFFRKKAQDVQIGDLVIVKNEGIHKTLGEVEPVLQESARYRSARATLYDQNAQGEYISKFRQLLLRGLADPNTENLEAKIMKEGEEDFSPEEYANFRQRILATGVEKASNVQQWLTGETLAPLDWDNFRKLISVNPTFQELSDSFAQDHGFHHEYSLYVGLRRTIMSYIAKRTGDHAGRERTKPRSPSESGKYKTEIELVVGHFMEEVDDATSVARVTEIKITQGKDKSSSAPPEPGLSKGIYVDKKSDLPLIEIGELISDYYVMHSILSDNLLGYYHSSFKAKMLSLMADPKYKDLEASHLLFLALSPRIKTLTEHVPHSSLARLAFDITERSLGKDNRVRELRDEWCAQFRADMASGDADITLGIPRQTIAKLVDVVNGIASALPKSYHTLCELRGRIAINEYKLKDPKKSRQQKNQIRDQIAKDASRLKKVEAYFTHTYGSYEPEKYFLGDYHLNRKAGIGLIDETRLEDKSVLHLKDGDKVLYQKQGINFYIKEDAAMVLRKYGFDDSLIRDADEDCTRLGGLHIALSGK